MNEQLKVGLLGLIAVTLIVQTYMEASEDDGGSSSQAATQTMNRSKSNVSGAKMKDQQNTPNRNNQNNRVQKDNEPSMPPTSIKFDQYTHDFGTIKQNTTNKKVFTFTNTGDKPYVIENAKGSCGCTVPTYPKKPIAPGEKGEIEVVYKPGKQKNQQTKTVTVMGNTQPRQTKLKIKANVQPE